MTPAFFEQLRIDLLLAMDHDHTDDAMAYTLESKWW